MSFPLLGLTNPFKILVNNVFPEPFGPKIIVIPLQEKLREILSKKKFIVYLITNFI